MQEAQEVHHRDTALAHVSRFMEKCCMLNAGEAVQIPQNVIREKMEDFHNFGVPSWAMPMRSPMGETIPQQQEPVTIEKRRQIQQAVIENKTQITHSSSSSFGRISCEEELTQEGGMMLNFIRWVFSPKSYAPGRKSDWQAFAQATGFQQYDPEVNMGLPKDELRAELIGGIPYIHPT